MLLVGDEIAETDEFGRPVVGDSFLVLLNAAGNGVNFTFPPRLQGRHAELVFDTCEQSRTELGAAGGYALRDHSTVVIRFPRT
jgi:glycogen operon protein